MTFSCVNETLKRQPSGFHLTVITIIIHIAPFASVKCAFQNYTFLLYMDHFPSLSPELLHFHRRMLQLINSTQHCICLRSSKWKIGANSNAENHFAQQDQHYNSGNNCSQSCKQHL